MKFRFLYRAVSLLALAAMLMSLTTVPTAAAAPPGDALAWGSNTFGQVGDGTQTHRLSPTQVMTLNGVTEVEGGDSFSLALKSDGTVWAWGRNNFGQLGNGTTSDFQATPVQVSNLSGVTAISAGLRHSLVLKGDGTVWAWGQNDSGQLGEGTTTNRLSPVQVVGPGGVGTLSGIIAIAGGGVHSLALRSDGTVLAWGENSDGQLGDNTTTNRITPVQVVGLTGVTGIAAGNGHSLAVRGDGTVRAWGSNGAGQLGDNTFTDRPTPVIVAGLGGAGTLNGISAVSAGGGHSLALRSDGTALAWGVNNFGQLGDGTLTIRATPVQVADLGSLSAISAGGAHSLALKGDGSTWAWGFNDRGQLGDGTTTDRTTPVQVTGPGGVGTLRAEGIRAGGSHSLAIEPAATAPPPPGGRFFPETGFAIDNDAFFDFFNKRGGLRTFGFPVSRTFQFLGFTTQFFQRGIVQLAPDGSVRALNVLDPGLMPYTTINGATFPGPDPAITSQAPVPGTPGYDVAVQAFVQSRSPDQFEGLPTNFYQTFLNTVTLGDAFPEGGGDPALLFGLNLELWGVPTSNPARDPNNSNFIYLRFQRGVMHFDATNNVTQGLLLADFLKAILTGQNLPADLNAQSMGSIFYKQYNPAKPNWIDRPAELPNTDLTNAFEKQS